MQKYFLNLYLYWILLDYWYEVKYKQWSSRFNYELILKIVYIYNIILNELRWSSMRINKILFHIFELSCHWMDETLINIYLISVIIIFLVFYL